MKLIRLKNTSDTYFDKAWELYEEAFPLEERRLLDAQARVMKNSNYRFDIMIHENQLIGFLLWWDFKSIRYIDHFATATSQRNKGFGTLIFEKFMNSSDKPILLEVELPNSTMSQRRIKFYERLGLKLNEHYYELPAFHEGDSPLQLLLMSYPILLSSKDVEDFVKTYHPIAFKD